MKISEYKITVQGFLFQRIITTTASSPEAAAHIAMNYEKCPRRCIAKVEETKIIYQSKQ